jgi:hypothetical protein
MNEKDLKLLVVDTLGELQFLRDYLETNFVSEQPRPFSFLFKETVSYARSARIIEDHSNKILLNQAKLEKAFFVLKDISTETKGTYLAYIRDSERILGENPFNLTNSDLQLGGKRENRSISWLLAKMIQQNKIDKNELYKKNIQLLLAEHKQMTAKNKGIKILFKKAYDKLAKKIQKK